MKIHFWIGPLFWFAIGIYVLISALKLGIGGVRHPGPGFIFFFAALFLLILNAIDFVAGFRASRFVDGGKKEKPLWLGVRWGKVLIVFGGLTAYVYFFTPIGFVLATLLLMLFLLKAVEPTRWGTAIAGSLIITLVSYAIFCVWLKVPFPEGFLGF